MGKLETAKNIIEKYYEAGDCGLFNSRNWAGDSMTTIYMDKEMQIDICYHWSYFEVFGLSEEEFFALRKFYEKLKNVK